NPARLPGALIGADVAEILLEVVGVGKVAEQHRGVHGLDQGNAGSHGPDAVAGRQLFRNREVVVVGRPDHLDPVRVSPRGRLYPQADDRVGPRGVLVEHLEGDAGTDITQLGARAAGALGYIGRTAAGSGGFVCHIPIEKGYLQVELPAFVQVVAGRQVEGEVVGVDLVDVDVAQKDRVQGQEAVENQLSGVVVAVGQAGFQTEGAVAEEAGCLVVQGFDTATGLGIFPETGTIAVRLDRLHGTR